MSQKTSKPSSPATRTIVRLRTRLSACAQWLTSLLARPKRKHHEYELPAYGVWGALYDHFEFHNPLRIAASAGDIAMVEQLLSRPDKNSTHQRTALCFAARANQLDVVLLVLSQYLLAQLVSGQGVCAEQEEAITKAATDAMPSASLALLSELISHCQDQATLAALSESAIEHRRLDVMRILVERTPDTSSAIVTAARYGVLDIIELLIQHGDPSAKENLALRTAAIHDQAAVVARLLPLSRNLDKTLEDYADRFAPWTCAMIRAHLDHQALLDASAPVGGPASARTAQHRL